MVFQVVLGYAKVFNDGILVLGYARVFTCRLRLCQGIRGCSIQNVSGQGQPLACVSSGYCTCLAPVFHSIAVSLDRIGPPPPPVGSLACSVFVFLSGAQDAGSLWGEYESDMALPDRSTVSLQAIMDETLALKLQDAEDQQDYVVLDRKCVGVKGK